MTREQIKKKLKLDEIGSFQEGRAWVIKGNKYGHVDKNGNITTPIIYDGIGNFYEGEAWVRINDFGFDININGYPIEHKNYYILIKSIF